MPANLVGSRALHGVFVVLGSIAEQGCHLFVQRSGFPFGDEVVTGGDPACETVEQQQDPLGEPFGVHVDADTLIPLRVVIAALIAAYVSLDRRLSRQEALEFA